VARYTSMVALTIREQKLCVRVSVLCVRLSLLLYVCE